MNWCKSLQFSHFSSQSKIRKKYYLFVKEYTVLKLRLKFYYLPIKYISDQLLIDFTASIVGVNELMLLISVLLIELREKY